MKFRLPENDFTEEEQDQYYEALLLKDVDNLILGEAARVPAHLHLKAYRREQKYSKAAMARMMGITARSYYGYEDGVRSIPSQALINLHAFTGCDLNEVLLGGTHDQNNRHGELKVAETIRVFLYLSKAHGNLSIDAKHNITAEVLSQFSPPTPSTVDVIERAVSTFAKNREDEVSS